jgi:hypothetical protein
MFKVPEACRIKKYSDESYGNNGIFRLQYEGRRGKKVWLQAIASDGEGWEHVSVSIPNLAGHPQFKGRLPIWNQMNFIKDKFWAKEDCVIQFHPPKSEYVNCHPFVLHLWRPTGVNVMTPPTWMIGPT